MGTFVVKVRAVGGHGCNRAVKNGEIIPKIEDAEHVAKCPDCLAREFAEKLRAAGCSFETGHATITHWPWPEGPTIVDNLLDGRRAGSFEGWK